MLAESASPHVLAVDDEAVNLELLEAVLAPQGYQLTSATDGLEGLVRAQETLPDAVLLDVMLPSMDGFAVCRALKADRRTRAIPVVLLTALRESDDRVTGFEAGADDFISKPFNRYELLARLRSLVRLRRLQEAEWVRFRRSLGRYLAGPAVEQVLNEPEMALSGRRQTVTVMFGDLRGFTALAEALEPERVVGLLNAYLGRMADIVFRHQGMVDKFMGDAIMAVFGAPTPAPDDPERAVVAALEMQAMAAALASDAGGAGLAIGIGINTGDAVVGNIGSEQRLEYTVIGDAVNLGARLEQAAGPGLILISHSTLERASHAIEAEALGELPVRGRQEGVRIYRVLGVREPSLPRLAAALSSN